MDRSMVPIFAALVALAAVCAVMAVYGGGEGGDSGNLPSGQINGFGFIQDDERVGSVSAVMHPDGKTVFELYIDPDTEKNVGSIRLSSSDGGICEAALDWPHISVHALSPGTSTITASAGGRSAVIDVRVEDGFRLSAGSAVLMPGFTAVIEALGSDSGAVSWTASDGAVCRISPDGNICAVTAMNAGTCYVTAESGGSTAVCKVGVVDFGGLLVPDEEIPGAAIPGASPLLEADLILSPGGSKTIDVPSEYLSLISWSSSDPSVCTVSVDLAAGTATAVAHKAGECELTASLGFMSAVCHVKVERAP